MVCGLFDSRCKNAGNYGVELHDVLLKEGIDIPVIFITGHGSVSLAVKSMKKGAIDFLEKPFSDEEICRLVDSSLQKARDVSDKRKLT